jgi:2-desacetyl-2-hydroxyethyl bacteriochlorophyllide A dehydrogenase
VTMRAWVMTGVDQGGVTDAPDPEYGDYDAEIEMLVCGICSSTDKMLRRGTFRMGVTYPSILGHESVGRVVRVGDRVRGMAVGDLVTRPSAYRPAVAPLDPYWGGFAERGVVTDWAAAREDGVELGSPRADQVVLPGSTDPALASLAISLSETYSVAVRHDLLGKTVAVIGTGIAGLSFVIYAKLLGAATVLAVGRRTERLALATDLGADVVALADDAEATAAGLGGVDVVFEASGQAAMTAAGYRWVASGGKVVVYSAPDTPAEIDLFTGPRDVELTVASTHEAAVLAQMVRLVETGAIDASAFLTHRYAFDDMPRAFDEIAHGDVVKAVVDLR